MRQKVLFVVVGRLGKTLTLSKILPIVETKIFDKVFVFREEVGFIVEGVEYITLPFLKRINNKHFKRLLRLIIEPVQLFFYSVKYRPLLINGYQLLPKGIYSFIVAKLTFTKCMISSIGGIPEIDTYSKHKWLFRSLNVFTLKHSDLITTKGKIVTDYIISRGVDKSKIHVFNGAIDTNKFNYAKQIEKNIDAIFVGKLSKLKGPDRFVDIIEGLVNKGNIINSVIVGEGEMYNEVVKTIQKKKLENYIKLSGHVEETQDLFKHSKMIIMPSSSEGLATAMLEAMACECVPIVSNVGCMQEAALHYETAMVVDNYKDINKFVEYAELIFSDKELRNNMAKKGRELIHAKYTIENQAKLFKSIIESHETKIV